jgi:hypothetical protein
VNETDDEARPAARAVPDRAMLTDAQWARLAPLLPPQKPKTGSRGGRPNMDHRLVVEGMHWSLRKGAAAAGPSQELRPALDGGEPVLPLVARPRWSAPKCEQCGFRETCWE